MAVEKIYLSETTKIFTTYVFASSINYNYLSEISSLYKESLEKYGELIKSGQVEKAKKVKEAVLKPYRDSLFTSPKTTDIDPKTGNNEYLSLVGKFLYYSIFRPESVKEKPPRNVGGDAKNVHESLINYKNYKLLMLLNRYNLVNNPYEDGQYFIDLKTIYNSLFVEQSIAIGSLIDELNEVVEQDFKKKELEVVSDSKKEKNMGFMVLEGFDVDDRDFIKYFTSENEKSFYEFLNKKWKEVLEEYKTAVKNKEKNSVKRDIKAKAINSLDELLEAYEFKKTFKTPEKFIFFKHPLRSSNAILQKFCVFVIYNYSSLDVEKNYYLGEDPKLIGEKIDSYTYKPFRDDAKNSSELSLNKLFKKFTDKAEEIFKELDKATEEIRKEESKFIKSEERGNKYAEHEANILRNAVIEEDFFFVKDLNNKKHIPISPYVEIEVKTYPENMFLGSSTTIPDWVSVTKRIDEIKYNNEIGDKFYSDNYFESFIMNDMGNEKAISLTLKSASETNLEDLLFNSLIGPIKKHKQSKTEGLEELIEIIKNKEANFRIRFGYNDVTNLEETINDSDINGMNFSSRTLLENMKKPVVKSPWLYFMINKFNANTIESETTFEIEGVSLGNYVIDNFVLYKVGGDNVSFSFTDDKGTPVNVLGEIAKALYESSGGNICILGNTEYPSVITGVENMNEYTYKRFSTENGSDKFATSDLDFDIFTSESVSASASSLAQYATSRPFSLITKKENENKKLPTIKESLNYLTDWLPTRMFALGKINGKNFAYKVEKTDDSIGFIRNNFTIKEIKPYYEILETNAKFEGDTNFSRKTFIRIFYKGPMSNEEIGGIRKYTYRGIQNSVVKNVSIENNVDFGKIKGTAGIIGAGFRSIYSADISVLPENSGSLGNIVNSYLSGNDSEGTTVMIAKDGIIYYDSSITEDVPNITKEQEKNNADRLASVFLYGMENFGYKGEIEILGDPFFLSDRSLQIGKYMIYLEINRNKNASYEGGYKRSYYTGLYYITGIEHSMNSSGEFATKLKITKFFAE